MPLDLSCTNDERILVTSSPKTSSGRPATVEGQVSARVVSGTGTFLAGPSPLSVYLVSGDDPGDTSYVIEADADLGAGVVLIQDTAVLHVAGAMAASLSLSAGSPEPKP